MTIRIWYVWQCNNGIAGIDFTYLRFGVTGQLSFRTPTYSLNVFYFPTLKTLYFSVRAGMSRVKATIRYTFSRRLLWFRTFRAVQISSEIVEHTISTWFFEWLRLTDLRLSWIQHSMWFRRATHLRIAHIHNVHPGMLDLLTGGTSVSIQVYWHLQFTDLLVALAFGHHIFIW